MKSIGNSAFNNCTSLKSIIIPDNVTSIGASTFSGCTSLKSVTISDSVTYIGNSAFYNCSGLKELTMPVSAKIYDSENTFYRCSNINKITLTKGTGTMQNYARYIDGTATYHGHTPWKISQCAEIIIEDGVTSIGTYAFYNCIFIKNITIPDSVTSIGNYAFSNCANLEQITVDDDNEYYSNDEFGALFNKDKTALVQYPVGNTRRSYAIPDSVTSIEADAFSGCIWLSELSIPVSAKIYNSSSTFSNCTFIEKITFTKGTGVMQNYGTSTSSSTNNTYYQYTPWYISRNFLKEIVIEDGVTSIGNYAFYNCTSLTSIRIPDSVTSIGEGAFYNCSGIKELIIPASSKIYNSQYTFYGCANIEKITITKGVGPMQNYVSSTGGTDTYYQYTPWYISRNKCTDIVIEDGVSSIGNYAFYNCISLESVTILAIVISIGKDAFYNTAYYNNANNWENDLLYINNHLIKAKTNLAGKQVIKEETLSISSGSFSNCSNLTGIILPNTITLIGESAFSNCNKLTNVCFTGTEDEWENISIGSDNNYLTSLYIHFDSDDNYFGVLVDSSQYPQSAHNYANNLDETKIFTYEGARKLEITFSALTEVEKDCDYIYVYDGSDNLIGKYTGTALAGKTLTIPGNTFKIKLTSNSSDNHYGYSFDSIVTNDWIITTAPECETVGEKTVACINCGELGSVSVEVPATGHAYGGLVDSSQYPESSHNYSNNTNQTKTFTYEGAAQLEITFSTSTKVESNYDYIYIYDGSGNLIGKYTGTTLAGKTLTIPGDTFKIKLTSDGSTIYYGYSFTSIVANNWVVTTEPDCVTTGEKSNFCTNCGMTMETAEIPATGHTYDNGVITTEPTCTERGIRTHTCLVCDDSYTADISALGHKHAGIIDESEYPESSHEYANNSDETQIFTYEGATQLEITFSSETYVESGFDYIYVYDGSDNLIGQYTGNELAGKTLTISDDTFKIKLTSNSSYTYYGYSLTSISVTCDWVVVNENNCANDGVKTRRCTVCGIIKENIPATGHLLDILVDSSQYPQSSHNYYNHTNQTKTFTYEGAGQLEITFSTSTKVESNYDYIYVYDGSDNLIGKYTGTTLAGKTLTITGDSFKIKLTSDSSTTYYGYSFTSIIANGWTVTTDPECKTVGEKSLICFTCGATIETAEIPALGHNYKIAVTSPTCTEDGYTTYICSVCNNIYTEEISARGHSYFASFISPTCTEQGYTTYTCSACGDNYKDNYVDANGHNFGNWILIKDSNCTEVGEEKRVCTECNAHESREITATGHSYNSVVSAPTCTSGGYTTYTCAGCKANYVADNTNATGHSYNNGVCSSCGDDKTARCSCNCHKGGISKIIFKIVLIFQKIFKTNKVCSCGANHY